MSLLINWFMQIPFWGRAMILLLLIMVVFWGIFRKMILWILSVIPYALKITHRYFFLLLEIPVAALHKRFGEKFHGIDNQLSKAGEKIDNMISYWYTAWHSPKKYHFIGSLLIYCICLIFVILPSFIETDNIVLKSGERIYSNCESFLITQLKKQNWYEADEKAVFSQADSLESSEEKVNAGAFATELLVSGITTSLLVRDSPSMKDGNILGRLKNNDKVIWRGEMQFSEVEDNRVEPWVKIETADGIVGWSRLFYLHPEPYADKDFYVIE